MACRYIIAMVYRQAFPFLPVTWAAVDLQLPYFLRRLDIQPRPSKDGKVVRLSHILMARLSLGSI